MSQKLRVYAKKLFITIIVSLPIIYFVFPKLPYQMQIIFIILLPAMILNLSTLENIGKNTS